MNTERITYAGRRRGMKTPLVHVYVSHEPGGKEWTFKKPLVASLGVGYVLEVTHPDDAPDSIYTKGEHEPRVVGFAEDDERVLGWQIADRAAYQVKAEADAAKRQEARVRSNLLEYQIGQIAQSAGDLPWLEREAFISYLANRVRNGR